MFQEKNSTSAVLLCAGVRPVKLETSGRYARIFMDTKGGSFEYHKLILVVPAVCNFLRPCDNCQVEVTLALVR